MIHPVVAVLGVLAIAAVFAILPPIGQLAAGLVIVLGGYLLWESKRQP
ncbi:MAG TPA: hypothetical protein VLG10_08115 [Methylomirabilota bacterium]|nr:hypothetical protein [Methylomirabilota bacterium]